MSDGDFDTFDSLPPAPGGIQEADLAHKKAMHLNESHAIVVNGIVYRKGEYIALSEKVEPK